MADYIDFSPIVRRLEHLTAATENMQMEVRESNRYINEVAHNVRVVAKDLAELQEAFEAFMDDTKKATTLQKAATELIRVRQELEQNYGGYKVVRETMLGVLQATDLALVKKTTISQVTEELMLATPDYWLAPCLVAVAAWIGNDRDLANRAIREAVKRDEEKTALTMALICRRNNRSDTCFEWLSIYFARQSAEHFTESNFTYLNAYINGVFGPDSKHVCDDYVSKWLREIQGHGETFEQEQKDLWRDYCNNFTVNLEGQFPHMTGSVREYADIAAYVSRINSVGRISYNFSGMQNVQVDDEKLKKDIDQTLVALISRCDDKEEPLRREEKYLQAVRYFDGDTEAAKRSVLEADSKRREHTIDLVSQMTNIIINGENKNPSERKTSVNFLSSYIRGGFRQYMTEKKDAFPQAITMKVDSWVGTSADGNNADALHAGFERHMRSERQQVIQSVTANAPQPYKPLPIWMTILMWIIFPVGIIYTIMASNNKNELQQLGQRVASIEADYNRRTAEGHQRIEAILAEWRKARSIVAGFESGEFPDVVA